ncbi:MAG: hypothetical protein RL707_449, partial [Pseudomonadota bacterium]
KILIIYYSVCFVWFIEGLPPRFTLQEEHNVGELAEACGYTAANMSRHLAVLLQQGFVRRDSRGTSVYYQISDPTIYALCDLVCDRITQQHLEQSWPLAATPKKRPITTRKSV